MCGILGIIDKKKLTTYDMFERALDLLTHRGPDAKGIFHYKNFYLGHRRLKILDLRDTASQPMVSECNNYVIVFNGEIYNFIELRDELSEKGYRFNTNCDTEVLLKAFIEYGVDAINKLNGMFSFCVYDKKKSVFYLVRDRLGIKPLYYYHDKTKFIFSSELKAVIKLLNLKPPLNYKALSSYLSYRYPILNDSFFENIFSLPPAHYMKIDLNLEKISIFKYWDVVNKINLQEQDLGEEYYIHELKSLLLSSVKYRMISDVPIGSYLSGGLDSSIITTLMATISTNTVKTFTIGFKEQGYNEFEFSNMISKKFKTQHHEILLKSKNYIENIGKLISFKDQPLSVPNEVPLFLMSKELSKHVKVVLSGEGSDELFAGYGKIFRSPYDYERSKYMDKNKKFINKFIKKYGVKKFDNEYQHFLYLYKYTSLTNKKLLLNENIKLDDIEEELNEKFKIYFNLLKNTSYYNKISYIFVKIHLIGLLQRLDTATMAASVEGRVPFLDHRLVELAFSMPFKYKLNWKKRKPKILMSDEISENYDTPKYILKKAYSNILPKKVLCRKKMGFPVPLQFWFTSDLKKIAKNILLDETAKNRGLYNLKNIKSILDNNLIYNNSNFAIQMWMLINIELFLRKYFD